MTSCQLRWCGGPSTSREPSSNPAGYVSQTGYQYDSISRVAGQRLLAPPSNFSKEGGFKNSVFKGVVIVFDFSIYDRKSASKMGLIWQYPPRCQQNRK